MVAFLAAQRTVLPVEEYALANVDLHVAFSSPRLFTGAVAKRTLRIGQFDRALARAYRTVPHLHHDAYHQRIAI
jgi:hypothetical protein